MLVLLGLNHRSAPLPVRERFAVPDDGLEGALDRLRIPGALEECVLVSTCNRVEILARASEARAGFTAVREFLTFARGVTPEDLARYTYEYQGSDAVRHLFLVASGLDSMVLGEPQITGQVKRAYEAARRGGHTGPVLDRLLQQALAAAKRVRTETGISRHAVSIAFAAVELARKIFGELEGRSVLLLGAGKMAELATRHLTANGVAAPVVSSRTFNRAVSLAERFGGVAVNWDDAFSHLERVDIVVSGTAAPEPILTRGLVQKAMRSRRSRPLFLIDIAVPRDVDPAVNTLENVYLYDIDDLQGVIDTNLEERKRAALDARRIIDEEVLAFDRWLQSLEISPTIQMLRETLHAIGRSELARFHRKLGPLGAEQARVVEELTRSVIQKILHAPIRHLKGCVDEGTASQCAALYRRVFDISELRDPGASGAKEIPDPELPSEPEASAGPHGILRGGKES